MRKVQTIDYDFLKVHNLRTGVDQNHLPRTASAGNSYLVSKSGEVTRIEERTVLPPRGHRLINIFPMAYTDENNKIASGSLLVEYFFKVK